MWITKYEIQSGISFASSLCFQLLYFLTESVSLLTVSPNVVPVYYDLLIMSRLSGYPHFLLGFMTAFPDMQCSYLFHNRGFAVYSLLSIICSIYRPSKLHLQYFRLIQYPLHTIENKYDSWINTITTLTFQNHKHPKYICPAVTNYVANYLVAFRKEKNLRFSYNFVSC